MKTTTIVTAGALLSLWTAGAAAQDALTVISWGGAYSKSQVEAYQKPFTARTGTEVRSADYLGGLAEVKAQVQSGKVSWDVIDLELSDAVRGCDEGLLERIDHTRLAPAPDGTPVERDFLPGALQDCAVGTVIWSSVYAYNDKAFPEAKPATIADFFDLKCFPGKRGFRKNPKTTLEVALMADGVEPAQVYKVLATRDGVDRAFRKLDTIKSEIVWWDANAQAPQMLNDGQVTMTVASSGRIFDAAVTEKRPFTIVWDGQIWSMQLYAVPKGSPRRDKAMDYVRFATDPERLAAQASWISYGPVRQSAIAKVGRHAVTGIEMAPHMPTAPANFRRAVQDDHQFWADNQDELNQRFQVWLAR